MALGAYCPCFAFPGSRAGNPISGHGSRHSHGAVLCLAGNAAAHEPRRSSLGCSYSAAYGSAGSHLPPSRGPRGPVSSKSLCRRESLQSTASRLLISFPPLSKLAPPLNDNCILLRPRSTRLELLDGFVSEVKLGSAMVFHRYFRRDLATLLGETMKNALIVQS